MHLISNVNKIIGPTEVAPLPPSPVFSPSESCSCHYSEKYAFLSPSSAAQRAPAASPSAHSISAAAATPDRTRFPRGSSSRSTFHGEQLRERRSAPYNGPPASPSHETGAFAHARRGTSTGIISKITSKFVRRSVPSGCGGFLCRRRNLLLFSRTMASH